MKLFGRVANKFKAFGITVFKVCRKNGRITYKLFNLPVFSGYDLFSECKQTVRNNKDFDCRTLDRKILDAVDGRCLKNTGKTVDDRIAFLASELYTTGGHTKWLLNMQKALSGKYKEKLFLTNMNENDAGVEKMLSETAVVCPVERGDCYPFYSKSEMKRIYKKITEWNPKVLFVFIHPDDVAGAAILGLLKKHTHIKILYCPHASHYPNLGISFADLTLEPLPTDAWITQRLRKFDKTHQSRSLIFSKAVADFPHFSPDDIARRRREIGCADGFKCVLSGAAAYKYFDENGSVFFETVKRLLERNADVMFFVLTSLSDEQKRIVEGVFSGSDARDRLRFLPFSADYELTFKCADVFMDSFPVSSALTMIDLMRLKVPAVVKINRENAHWSFHEYQRPDYPYMFETADGMLAGVERLLSDPAERDRIAEMSYANYLTAYEMSAAAKHLIEIIENSDHLERFYDKPVEGERHFKELGI